VARERAAQLAVAQNVHSRKPTIPKRWQSILAHCSITLVMCRHRGRGAIYSQRASGARPSTAIPPRCDQPRQPTVVEPGLGLRGQASALDDQFAILSDVGSQHRCSSRKKKHSTRDQCLYQGFELDRRNAKYVLRRGVVNSTLANCCWMRAGRSKPGQSTVVAPRFFSIAPARAAERRRLQWERLAFQDRRVVL